MKLLLIFLVISLLGCQTISKKIDEKTTQEEIRLSRFLNGTENNLKAEMGKPDRIDFKENNRNRFYVYNQEKFKIKCERVFEINDNNVVIGFTSKNCF